MSMPMERPIISCQNLSLSIKERTLFRNVNFSICPGERVSIVGTSGCGKSSLLSAIIGQAKESLHISDGEILVAGKQTGSKVARKWLNTNAGILFQYDALLAELTVEENLRFPLIHGTQKRKVDAEEIDDLLASVELPLDVRDKRIEDLSGGQQKRVALARALITKPTLLILDEPTSGLDPKTTAAMVALLTKICRSRDMALLCVTHDHDFARQLDCKIVELEPAENHASQLGSRPSLIKQARTKLFSAGSLAQYPARALSMFIGNALICLPVGFLIGIGLVAQSLHGPSWMQTFLPKAIVAGVFLGLGTIVPALLVIGHSGSGITAELAQRKSAEQFNYFESIGLSPHTFLTLPICCALLVVTPLLVVLTEYSMIYGARFALTDTVLDLMQISARMTPVFFEGKVMRLVGSGSGLLERSLAKAFTHGGVIGIISCLSGFCAKRGAKGLRAAVSKTVILASFGIIIADLLWSVLWPGL